MALPVAVQLYTLREEMKVDMRATLEKVKALGYEGVEFAGLFGKTGEEVRDMCQEIGLVPLSAHVPTLIWLRISLSLRPTRPSAVSTLSFLILRRSTAPEPMHSLR